MSDNDNDKMDQEVEELRIMAEEMGYKKPPGTTFKEFLESCPANECRKVIDVLKISPEGHSSRGVLIPSIQLYCGNEDCQGVRYFDYLSGDQYVSNDKDGISLNFLVFRCRNCRAVFKTYAIEFKYSYKFKTANISKLGEFPKFGLPVPTRLTKLIKDKNDLDLFNKGFDCENQGKGIGAFTYYRRMVDSVKDQLIDEIAKAVKKIDPDHEMLNHLEEAKKETRFKEAINKIKDTLPKELYVDGINPLTALYGALSQGIHDLTDGECQDRAHDVRLVLTELLERAQFIITEKKTITDAIRRLTNSK